MWKLRVASPISFWIALASPILFSVTVVLLGTVTPGYNHFAHTISRLAIEKYGIFQVINFLQLAFGLSLLGVNVAATMSKRSSKQIIRTVFTVCSGLLILAAFVPTDPIENVSFSLKLFTPPGFIHALTVIVFLLISPFGIVRLTRTFASEPSYAHFSKLTIFMGFVAFVASLVWLVFFLTGLFPEYRGLFQKIITLWTIIWIVVLNLATAPLIWKHKH